MDITEVVFNKLITIQDKHVEFFKNTNTDIFSWIYIHWDPLYINVIHPDMPYEIKLEIEAIAGSI
jgi:hypothetical protein